MSDSSADFFANDRSPPVDEERRSAPRRESDRRKDEFMSVLSHELRNPLAPLRNATYMLNHCVPASEEANRARLIIERQVSHLSRLVDDLLDVSRIARGKADLRMETLDFERLVRQLVEDHRAVIASTGLRCEACFPQRPVWITGDASRLAQVVRNLLQNAIKFTSTPGTIAIAIDTEEGHASLSVRDTGTGIAPELLERIFEPFTQGSHDSQATSPGGGLGIGLALVKGFTELHGGSVRAASEGLGKGSVFTVTLPLSAAAVSAYSGRALPLAGAPGKRVLIVDDNRDAADSLASIVRMFGHQVHIAYDGIEGLEIARSLRPDVLLCDLGLPSLDGYAIARAIRSDASLATTRLVAVSGYAQAEDRRKSREAGFERHIAKPADPDLVLQAIAQTAN